MRRWLMRVVNRAFPNEIFFTPFHFSQLCVRWLFSHTISPALFLMEIRVHGFPTARRSPSYVTTDFVGSASPLFHCIYPATQPHPSRIVHSFRFCDIITSQPPTRLSMSANRCLAELRRYGITFSWLTSPLIKSK